MIAELVVPGQQEKLVSLFVPLLPGLLQAASLRHRGARNLGNPARSKTTRTVPENVRQSPERHPPKRLINLHDLSVGLNRTIWENQTQGVPHGGFEVTSLYS